MRIVIAGGSGFLGARLCERLVADGHQVLVLTRGQPETARPWKGPVSRVSWTPDGTVGPWASAIDGAEAVVNLAGETIGEGRWTARRKTRILDSRLHATRSLAGALRAATARPRVLLNASAQGYYGDRGDEELTEDASAGAGFLAGVCARWEAAAQEAATVTRVVMLRTSLVLAADGGALPRMLTPFRLFVGGPLGSGRQFMSWIHRDDWVGMAVWALADERVSGPLNVGAPSAIRNRDFSAAIGRALHRPSWMPAPAVALRVVLGEMADALVLGSTRMVPARALALGYPFRHPELGTALADVLG